MTIKAFAFNPFQENTYLVSNKQGETMVIDPGCYNPAEENILSDYITRHNLKVTCVVNTHLHIDHVLGDAFLEKLTGVKAVAHAADAFWLNSLDAQCRMFGLHTPKEKADVQLTLKEGDTLRLGEETFAIVEVPGHSPGSIALYNAGQGCLFVGDALFAGSIGRTDLTGGNYETLIRNLQDKLMTLPDNTTVFCGHGPSTTIGTERRTNPFL